MRRNRRLPILVALMSLAAGVAPAWEGPAAPEDLKHIEAGGESMTLWPYTTSDFESPSDPINLVFPNADPRAIRQELLKLDGNRPPFASLPGGNCRWTDAMGYEQAAYREPLGWVGGAVQLACVQPGAPLGSPFRFHIRLFRSGVHTLGNAHFEFLIPGTAEHQVLSWDLARNFATYDMLRTGASAVAPVGLIPAGAFRTVRRPVYDALVQGAPGRCSPRWASSRPPRETSRSPRAARRTSCRPPSTSRLATRRPPPRPASTTRLWCRSRSARPARRTSSSSKGLSTSR